MEYLSLETKLVKKSNHTPSKLFAATLLVLGMGIAGCGKETNSVVEPPADWAPTPVGEDQAYNDRMAAEMSGQVPASPEQ